MAYAFHINSTNDRAKKSLAPPWFRNGFRLVGAMVPDAAASMGHHLFFTPRGARLRDDERAVLAQGERFSFDVDGSNVIARTWGEGPTVILAHGWGGHSGQMTSLVQAVVAAGYRAVAIDFPGHGESEGRLSSIVHFARALERGAALFSPIHGVIAHSLGAAATTFAMTRTLRPTRVAFFAPATEFEPMWAQFREDVGVSDVVWQKMQKKAEGWLNVSMRQVFALEHAPRMTAPLLVLHDVADRQVGFEQGEKMAQTWPNAALVRTEQLGHIRILHDPRAIAAAVDFLER
ncbi:alpha/beta hydrolase [Pendulispora albinea]|uniref:Lysophospholipase n=1 Tax=Pendulispora albinea TaxID=2741071 RepID=A0ABZ2LQ88_9BACT